MSGFTPADHVIQTHMGSCGRRQYLSLYAIVDVAIQLRGYSPLFYRIEWPAFPLGNPNDGIANPFPGPLPVYGWLNDTRGYVALWTRIRGQCPTAGNWAATYDFLF